MKCFYILLLAGFLAGCATNPATKGQDFVLMSEKEELGLGAKAAAQVEKEMRLLPKSDPLTLYVDKVGQRLAKGCDRPELFYRFHVVDDGTINAFALPGGYIYIHRGLIAHLDSEAELAAVLGHEIGHVTARHAVQAYTKAQAYGIGMMVTSVFVPIPQAVGNLSDLMMMGIIRGFGRENELQSDELSLRYLTVAGYDPQATENILQTLQRLDDIDVKEKKDAGEKVERYHGAFSTHPETRRRIEEVIAKEKKAQGSGGEINHEALLKVLDGYPYADSAEEGAVIGTRFIHPKLGLQFSFPDGWVVKNFPDAVNGKFGKEKVYFLMRSKALQKRQTAAEVLASAYPERNRGKISEGVLNGYQYARVEVSQSAPNVTFAKISAWLFLDKDVAYLIEMWADRDQFASYQTPFQKIAESFRPYDKAKDGDVPRIALHTWQSGDSWQKLAEASHNLLGNFTADRLAALNGMSIEQMPKVGETIKVVK